MSDGETERERERGERKRERDCVCGVVVCVCVFISCSSSYMFFVHLIPLFFFSFFHLQELSTVCECFKRDSMSLSSMGRS